MPLVLATDLDGTFLGGSAQQRGLLYEWLAQRRAEITLIYVTGRGLSAIRELMSTLPSSVHPDHVVANVGTTAVTGPKFSPLHPVEAWLDAQWPQTANTTIAQLMQQHAHLEPQPSVEGRRMSYFFRDIDLAEKAKTAVEEAGFDALISDNLYFDVLPKGVCKGPTLLRTLDALGLSRDDVLVAGDTLNDLSLFETGLRGVAVSNSEPALKLALHEKPNVLQSSEPGAAGILQALTQFAEARGLA